MSNMTAEDDDGGAAPANRQRSPLQRGLRTLELLAFAPRTVADVARLLGVNRSSAHRLLRELEECAYVVRDEATHRYSLARKPIGEVFGRRGLVAIDGGALDREWHEEL